MFVVWGEVFMFILLLVLFYMIVVMIVGIYGFIVLGGYNFIWEGIKFKGFKMNFLSGFKCMFGINGLVELLKFIVKVVVVIGMVIGVFFYF